MTTPEQVAQVAAASVLDIDGPTIMLGSGGYFNYEHPERTPFTPADLAWALAGNARFAGQTRRRKTGRRCLYTVAQHCVLGSWYAPPELRYPFLIHESGEGPMGDLVGPAKPCVLTTAAWRRSVSGMA